MYSEDSQVNREEASRELLLFPCQPYALLAELTSSSNLALYLRFNFTLHRTSRIGMQDAEDQDENLLEEENLSFQSEKKLYAPTRVS
ncbi:hypothetical protein KQX54_008354 [Cotesia glomerata]|uniref:Uncharacterized protein n=1 Tax=Cotesia glomerata TaxID=32391 RepID=A0AAV7J3U0_COTGL|nr:hypothetical protein KQX54_008354 [Cotesia glomerata]